MSWQGEQDYDGILPFHLALATREKPDLGEHDPIDEGRGFLSDNSHTPRQAIGLVTAISLVVGCMIGTGVFLKPAIMAAEVGSVTMVLAAWLFAGLLSLAGALTYGELTSRMPAAGGEYAILHSTYGEFPAYLYGWMRFTIGAPGSAASYAVGAATFLHVAYPYETLGLKIWQVAVIFVAFFTLINTLTILVSASV